MMSAAPTIFFSVIASAFFKKMKLSPIAIRGFAQSTVLTIEASPISKALKLKIHARLSTSPERTKNARLERVARTCRVLPVKSKGRRRNMAEKLHVAAAARRGKPCTPRPSFLRMSENE